MNIVVLIKKTFVQRIIITFLVICPFFTQSQEFIVDNKYSYGTSNETEIDYQYKRFLNNYYNQSPFTKAYPVAFRNLKLTLSGIIGGVSIIDIRNFHQKDTIAIEITDNENIQEFLELIDHPQVKLISSNMNSNLIGFLEKLNAKNIFPNEIAVYFKEYDTVSIRHIKAFNKIKNLKFILRNSSSKDLDFLKQLLSDPDCSITSLVVHNLNTNKLIELVKQIKHNKKIKELEVHGYSKIIEDSNFYNNLYQLTNLEKLSINDWYINIDHRIKNLSELKYLQIKVNNNKDTSNYLNCLKNIEELYLENYGGNLNKMVLNMKNLKSLSLSYASYWSWYHPKIVLGKEFENLTKIEAFNIHQGTINFNISRLKKLKYLQITNENTFRENLKVVRKISRLPEIKTMYFRMIITDTFNFINSKINKLYYNRLGIYTRYKLSKKHSVNIDLVRISDDNVRWILFTKNFYSKHYLGERINEHSKFFNY
jgi:hypothetical protein